jgi:hypothetical protein
MLGDALDFHRVEYDHLRSEILFNQRQMRESLSYSLFASAVVYAWVFANFKAKSDFLTIFVFVSWIPALIVAGGWLFFFYLQRNVLRIASYCLLIEERFADRALGWGQYLNRLSGDHRVGFRIVFNSVFLMQLAFALYVGATVTRLAFFAPQTS